MSTDNKEDLIKPLETNLENKAVEDGLNNENNLDVILTGGDNEQGLPSIQEKVLIQNNKVDEPDNEEIESPKAEIENPHIKTIIKKNVGEEEGGDKVDIDFPKGITVDSPGVQPTDEYLEN